MRRATKPAAASPLAATLAAVAACLLAPLPASADTGPTPLMLLSLLGVCIPVPLTLAIELPIVALPLRKRVRSMGKFLGLLVLLNLCSYAGLVFVLAALPQITGVSYPVALLVGEVAVMVGESIILWQIVKASRLVDLTDLASPRRRIVGLVLLANLASCLLGVLPVLVGLTL